jgi:hypothetical protein
MPWHRSNKQGTNKHKHHTYTNKDANGAAERPLKAKEERERKTRTASPRTDRTHGSNSRNELNILKVRYKKEKKHNPLTRSAHRTPHAP